MWLSNSESIFQVFDDTYLFIYTDHFGPGRYFAKFYISIRWKNIYFSYISRQKIRSSAADPIMKWKYEE